MRRGDERQARPHSKKERQEKKVQETHVHRRASVLPDPHRVNLPLGVPLVVQEASHQRVRHVGRRNPQLLCERGAVGKGWGRERKEKKEGDRGVLLEGGLHQSRPWALSLGDKYLAFRVHHHELAIVLRMNEHTHTHAHTHTRTHARAHTQTNIKTRSTCTAQSQETQTRAQTQYRIHVRPLSLSPQDQAGILFRST